MSNQTNLLLNNLKIIVDKLQSEKASFKTQVDKLIIEKNQLLTSNNNLIFTCFLSRCYLKTLKQNYLQKINTEKLTCNEQRGFLLNN